MVRWHSQTRLGATGDIHHRPPSFSLLCVSQWSGDRCVYQSGGENSGIKPGADACSCIYQITGWSGWWGSPLRLCVLRVFREGYAGVTAGSGGGGRGRVESYDLKEPFFWSVCQRAPQQTQSQVWLVLLAELMRACALRAGALMFWVAGSLCFLSCAPSLPVPHQKWKASWEADVLRHVFIHIIHPLLYTFCVHSFCISTVQQGSITIFIANSTNQIALLYTYNHPVNQSG